MMIEYNMYYKFYILSIFVICLYSCYGFSSELFNIRDAIFESVYVTRNARI